ncbi:hypothetical protein BaRGS_00012839 [Batillaria attramentaria]|uniref:Secreted protein n=1 Tax=Batillaria attramentaria TaxID=370345 RepID=A0ABD0L9N6_9CAEN
MNFSLTVMSSMAWNGLVPLLGTMLAVLLLHLPSSTRGFCVWVVCGGGVGWRCRVIQDYHVVVVAVSNGGGGGGCGLPRQRIVKLGWVVIGV